MTDIMAPPGRRRERPPPARLQGHPPGVAASPGPDFVDRIVAPSDRSPAVMRSLQQLVDHGRLAGTGYLSILLVDQGIEHSAGASFAKNPLYFDPENIVKLAIEGGCNAVASTLGVLGARLAQVCAQDSVPASSSTTTNFSRTPTSTTRSSLASVKQAQDHRRGGVGATIYLARPSRAARSSK